MTAPRYLSDWRERREQLRRQTISADRVTVTTGSGASIFREIVREELAAAAGTQGISLRVPSGLYQRSEETNAQDQRGARDARD